MRKNRIRERKRYTSSNFKQSPLDCLIRMSLGHPLRMIPGQPKRHIAGQPQIA